MWQSLRISHLLLRLFLAVVFLGFGVAQLLHPASGSASLLHMSATHLAYGLGILELLISVSLAANMFVEFFAFAGTALLFCTLFFYGFNEAAFSALGLIGAMLALVFWPGQKLRFY